MTILELIRAACKTKGVPEKYAERIQKTFKIEKAEGMEAYVDLFKENVLPAIQEAENEAKTAAEAAAVSAYIKGNTAQSPPDGFARNLRADFPSYCPEIPCHTAVCLRNF